MILLYLKTFQALLIPFILGYSVMMVLFKDLRLPFRLFLPLSYGLGMGLLTHWMLLLGILNIPFGLKTICLPLLFLSLFFVFARLRYHPAEIKRLSFSPSRKLTGPQQALLVTGIIYVLYMTFYVFWRALNIPLKDWDAVSFIGYKAMVFFYERSLYQHANLPHASYPLHTSFAEAWVAFNLNQWHSILVKVIFPAYFLSIISMAYGFLRVWVSRLMAVFGVVLILSSNIFNYHATIGYKDFVVMFYACSTIMLLMLWQKQKHAELFFLSALMAGLGSFVKNEAALYLAVYYFVFLVMLCAEREWTLVQRLKKFLIFLTVSLGICAAYQTYRIAAGITIKTYDTHLGFDVSHLNRAPGIALMFMNNLFTSAGWNFVWFLFFLSLLQYKKIIRSRELWTIVLSVLSFLGLYAAGLLVSPQYEFFKKVSQFTVLSRVFLHFFPLSALAVALINGTEDPAVQEQNTSS